MPFIFAAHKKLIAVLGAFAIAAVAIQAFEVIWQCWELAAYVATAFKVIR